MSLTDEVRMRQFCWAAYALLAASALAAPAHADPVLVQAAGATRTVNCAEAPLEIDGARNLITVTGRCTGLQIRGDGNDVSLPLSGVAPVDIEGSRNRVRYTAMPGTNVQLHVAGDGTAVTPGPYAPAPPAALASISGNGLDLDLDCNNGTFTLDSVGSAIALRGQCKAVVLHGEANVVRADLAPEASVEIEGNADTLLYRVPQGAALPKTKLVGMGSLVADQSSLAAAIGARVAPQKLPVPLLMRLLDAQVQAPGTLVQLPSAIFAPTGGLSAAGEIQLQRLGGLLLQAWPSAVRIVGHGPSPDAGRKLAAAVSDYMIDHGVPGLSAQLDGDVGGGSVDVWLLK
jgi:hypothetical protein